MHAPGLQSAPSHCAFLKCKTGDLPSEKSEPQGVSRSGAVTSLLHTHLLATAVSLPYGLRAGLRLSIHTIPVCVQFLQAGGSCGSCRFGSVLQES